MQKSDARPVGKNRQKLTEMDSYVLPDGFDDYQQRAEVKSVKFNNGILIKEEEPLIGVSGNNRHVSNVANGNMNRKALAGVITSEYFFSLQQESICLEGKAFFRGRRCPSLKVYLVSRESYYVID